MRPLGILRKIIAVTGCCVIIGMGAYMSHRMSINIRDALVQKLNTKAFGDYSELFHSRDDRFIKQKDKRQRVQQDWSAYRWNEDTRAIESTQEHLLIENVRDIADLGVSFAQGVAFANKKRALRRLMMRAMTRLTTKLTTRLMTRPMKRPRMRPLTRLTVRLMTCLESRMLGSRRPRKTQSLKILKSWTP